jgi:methyl-accepting chemotaxis protein
MKTAPSPRRVSPRRRWKSLLLDPGLQLRLGAALGAVATALSLALGWQVWRAYREASRLVALADPRADALVASLLRAEDGRRIALLAAVLAVVVVVLGVAAVVASHRIAGPAFALGGACREVAAGALPRPRPLRRGDLLGGLGADVSAMLAALRAREEEERALLAEAAAAAPERAREIAAELAERKARRLEAGE